MSAYTYVLVVQSSCTGTRYIYVCTCTCMSLCYAHVCACCACAFFTYPVNSLGNIIPATGFLFDQTHKVLEGSEGCSSQGIPRGDLPHPQKTHQQPRPWSTADSCTDCCSKGTEMAGKSCYSRWSLKPGQVRSPRALCWWQQECLGWPYVPLKKEKKKTLFMWGSMKDEPFPLNPGNASPFSARSVEQSTWIFWDKAICRICGQNRRSF